MSGTVITGFIYFTRFPVQSCVPDYNIRKSPYTCSYHVINDYNPISSKVTPYSIKSYSTLLGQTSKSGANGCRRITLVPAISWRYRHCLKMIAHFCNPGKEMTNPSQQQQQQHQHVVRVENLASARTQHTSTYLSNILPPASMGHHNLHFGGDEHSLSGSWSPPTSRAK